MTVATSRRRLLLAVPALGLVAAKPRADEPLGAVLFGSCLDTFDHPMLDVVLSLPRDLFLFMGDNIYADQGGVPLMQEKYAQLKQSRFFRGLQDRPLLATWDDHDFGLNDGGAECAVKREAQAEFWNWLDEPADSPRRAQEGVYHARSFGPEGRRVQVVMLDTRFFRSPLATVPKERAMLGGRCVPTDDAATTVLGPEQWRWLEAMLAEPAELRIIVSSIQFGPEPHGGECWANFPHEQRRLLAALEGRRCVVLSGDRHWSEFSRHGVFDFTSSSLTQKHVRGTPTPNRHRVVPRTYHEPNVGLLLIDWQGSAIDVRIIGVDGEPKIQLQAPFADLVV